jgi:hypothetical protein
MDVVVTLVGADRQDVWKVIYTSKVASVLPPLHARTLAVQIRPPQPIEQPIPGFEREYRPTRPQIVATGQHAVAQIVKS